MGSMDARGNRYRRLLRLGSGAGLAEIRRSYRAEMKRVHPDLVGGDGAKASELNVARDYLEAELASSVRTHDGGAIRCPAASGQAAEGPATPSRPTNAAPARATQQAPHLVFVFVVLYFAVLGLAVLGWLVTTVQGIP